MTIKMFCYLAWCFLSLLSYFLSPGIKVFASDPTPSPTLEPLWDFSHTPTPPDGYYACTDYIIGYGTRTPSPLWMMRCGTCLNAFKFNLTRTALPPGSTLVPSITPTIDPLVTQTPTWYPTSPAPVLYVGNVTTWSYYSTHASWGSSIATEIYHLPVDSLVVGYIVGIDNDYVNATNVNFEKILVDGKRLEADPNNFSLGINHPHNELDFSAYQSLYEDFLTMHPTSDPLVTKLNHFQLPSSGTWEVYHKVTYRAGTVSFNLTIAPIIYGVPDPVSTPTPSPSSTPLASDDLYCDEIDDGITQTSADLPRFYVGEELCTEFAGVTVDFSNVNWLPGFIQTEIGYPGWRLCVVPLHFGTISILSFVVDLDILAGISATIAMLKMLIRS